MLLPGCRGELPMGEPTCGHRSPKLPEPAERAPAGPSLPERGTGSVGSETGATALLHTCSPSPRQDKVVCQCIHFREKTKILFVLSDFLLSPPAQPCLQSPGAQLRGSQQTLGLRVRGAGLGGAQLRGGGVRLRSLRGGSLRGAERREVEGWLRRGR